MEASGTPRHAECNSARRTGIKGFLETSFLDWPGRVCGVIFLAGCNFRCPFCHNHPLVLAPEGLASHPAAGVLDRLHRFKSWLGGLCISGGEPTLYSELEELLLECKRRGWLIKLDTNGSQPLVLERLLAAGLLDMVAMDVKAPLVREKYVRCVGVPVDLDAIRASIDLLRSSGVEHEFRMTVLPSCHTAEDILAWAETLAGPSSLQPSRLRLQNFRSISTLDPSFGKAETFPPEKFAALEQMVADRMMEYQRHEVTCNA